MTLGDYRSLDGWPFNVQQGGCRLRIEEVNGISLALETEQSTDYLDCSGEQEESLINRLWGIIL